MKKSLLVFWGICIALIVHGQGSITTKTIQKWSETSSDWEDSLEIRFTYFYNGDSTVGDVYTWDANLNEFLPSGRQVKMIVGNKLRYEAEFSYDPQTKLYIPDIENIYSYGSIYMNGTFVSFLDKRIDRQWNSISSEWDTLYSYKSKLNFSSGKVQEWTCTDGRSMENLWKEQYLYDPYGILMETRLFTWSTSVNDWVQQRSDKFTYSTSSGNVIEVNYQNSSDPNDKWREVMSENSSGVIESYIRERWDPVYKMYKSFYEVYISLNVYADPEMEIHQSVINNVKFNEFRILYGYESGASAQFPETSPVLISNPVKNTLSILSSGQLNKVVIYDQMGRLVLESERPGNNQIDVSGLIPGMYIVEFSVENQFSCTRFCINR